MSVSRFLSVAVLVGLALVMIAPPSSAHTQCAHNTSAIGGDPPESAWWSNWWVGYSGSMSCDLNGNFTVGIQRINWHYGYRQSGVDGYYGPNTHQDVRSFQSFWQMSLVDGLVGHNTWWQYGYVLHPSGYNGSFYQYRIKDSFGPITFARDTAASPQEWYVVGLSQTWKRFWIYGPN